MISVAQRKKKEANKIHLIDDKMFIRDQLFEEINQKV